MEDDGIGGTVALVGTCVAGVLGIASLLAEDRESQRVAAVAERRYSPERQEYKLQKRYMDHAHDLERQKLENEQKKADNAHRLEMEMLKNERARIEAENFRLELQAKQEAFRQAVAAEERLQNRRIEAAERIALTKLDFLNQTRQTVERFYIPLMETLRIQYAEVQQKITPSTPQAELIALQKERNSISTLISDSEDKFNKCLKDLQQSISQVGKGLPKAKVKKLLEAKP